jgi:hypothetical protein
VELPFQIWFCHSDLHRRVKAWLRCPRPTLAEPESASSRPFSIGRPCGGAGTSPCRRTRAARQQAHITEISQSVSYFAVSPRAHSTCHSTTRLAVRLRHPRSTQVLAYCLTRSLVGYSINNYYGGGVVGRSSLGRLFGPVVARPSRSAEVCTNLLLGARVTVLGGRWSPVHPASRPRIIAAYENPPGSG